MTSNASESVEIDMGELVEGTLTMTVNIVGTRRFRVRLFIALQLMRIVSWIAPFKVEMEIEE